MDSNAALAELKQAQSTAQNPNDILAAQRQQFGVQAAQDTAKGLRGAIDNTTNLLKKVAPSVMGRTANSLVTNAQATRQISNESAPLNQTLGEQTGQYNEAEKNAADLESKASNAAQGIYQGQQDKVSYLKNLYDILYGREQDAAKAAADEAARQEAIRQFNVSAASKGSSGKTLSAKEAAAQGLASLADHVRSQFDGNVGSDGRVGNNTWSSALRDWQTAGGSTREFWQRFGAYVNPKYKSSYAGYAQR